MQKLPRNIKGEKLLKALEKLGFKKYKGKGSHIRLKHSDGRWTQVPVHPKPIPQGTLKRILKQANINPDKLLEVY